MTYRELYEKALWDLEHNNITSGEFDERVKPLNQEPTRWIPVSERLPEKSGEYLLCGKIGGHEEDNYCFIGEYTPYETFGFTHEYYDTETFSPIDSEIIEFHSVIAWMPLPKPYTAERSE